MFCFNYVRYLCFAAYLLLIAGCGVKGDGTDETRVSMGTNVSLPHYIKEHSKALVVLKLSNDNGDPLIIGSHSDATHDVKITNIFINNKGVSLAKDLAGAETCFNDQGFFERFTHECTIPLYVTASQLGALNFDVSVSTTTNQVFDKHFSTTVKPQGDALLDEPILNFLSAHKRDLQN